MGVVHFFTGHFSVLCGVGAAKLEDTQRLHRDLFHRYNTMVRPIQDQDEPVTINMDLYVTAITNLVSYYLFIGIYTLKEYKSK